MTTAAERKFVNLRKRLDQLGYRQPLGVESLPLVEKLFRYSKRDSLLIKKKKTTKNKTTLYLCSRYCLIFIFFLMWEKRA